MTFDEIWLSIMILTIFALFYELGKVYYKKRQFMKITHNDHPCQLCPKHISYFKAFDGKWYKRDDKRLVITRGVVICDYCMTELK